MFLILYTSYKYYIIIYIIILLIRITCNIVETFFSIDFRVLNYNLFILRAISLNV